MTTNDAAACVLVAAGRGERLGGGQPKAFVDLGGRPLVWHAMSALARTTRVGEVVVVVPDGYRSLVTDLAQTLPAATSCTFQSVTGGSTRQESVALGLAAVTDAVDVVLVHDAARCLAPPELYDAVVDDVRCRDAVVPGLPPVDTLKQVDVDGRVVATPDRAQLRSIQTPQGFRRDLLAHAYVAAEQRGDLDAPDDASLVERLDVPVYVIPGHPDAFKITRPHDLLAAEAVLARQAATR